MESEASLLMANQALANPGKWIYDPFAGTGSLLLTASAFGACTFGSDIDGRQIRGKSCVFSFSASLLSLAQRLVVFSIYLVTDVMCYRFRTTETGIRHSAEQYGVWNRILDCYTFDMTVRPPPFFTHLRFENSDS